MLRIQTEKRAVGKEPVTVHYCWDITKRCQNLLSSEQEQRKQNYYWGYFLEGIKEDRAESFILDELGSPLRIVGITGKEQAVYSYDEFGYARYENTGVNQPFGYTGYLVDDIGGTYFANAREYVADIGRFTGEDLLPGSIYSNVSLNRYIYCRNDSVNYIDLDGNIPLLAVFAIGAAVGAVVDLGFQAYDIYKSGEEITDIKNYNLVQTAVSAISSGVSALIPTAAAGIAAKFGVSAVGTSAALYAGSGAVTEVALENISNPEATVKDNVVAALEGAGFSLLGFGVGKAVNLSPAMQRMERAYGHAQMALASTLRGTSQLDIPPGFYLDNMKALAIKMFSIGQTMDIVTMLSIESSRRLLDEDTDNLSIDNKE